MTGTETVKPIPSKRLDKQIREAVLQHGWDRHGISDLYDPDKEEALPAGYAPDDPLLRIVLLCRARSPEWYKVLKKAITHADLKHHYHERRPRYLLADTPEAERTRQELYQEMASQLIDPLTMKPADTIGMSNRTFAREVADGNIQLEYSYSTKIDASRERI